LRARSIASFLATVALVIGAGCGGDEDMGEDGGTSDAADEELTAEFDEQRASRT
jgi:hypothetical protein